MLNNVMLFMFILLVMGQMFEHILNIAAWETLGHPVKRKSYDSVDPMFDDSVPANNAQSKENFIEIFKPVFERNARYYDTHASSAVQYQTFVYIFQI